MNSMLLWCKPHIDTPTDIWDNYIKKKTLKFNGVHPSHQPNPTRIQPNPTYQVDFLWVELELRTCFEPQYNEHYVCVIYGLI